MSSFGIITPLHVLLALSFTVPAGNCHHASGQSKITEGLSGKVYELTGNQMPSPDVKPAEPKGVKTTVYIYELTNLNQVIRKNNEPFYESIHTRLVTTVESDSAGKFETALAPGNYSLFVKRENLYYANEFDGNNNIQSVEILPGKMTTKDIRISYRASF